ncbi:MAG: hypothetical protein EXR98_05235 [Gemmataceae bacterium]|nr:hypothetical protein [Gemmataceae bacterium]
MAGDDTSRFCGQCSLHVYNLSEMSQTEAEAVILEHEGHLCVRFYQRADGTMMTKDCPVGWRAVKRRLALLGGAAAAVVAALFSLLTFDAFAAASVRGNGNGGVRFVNPIDQVQNWLFPPVCVMGEMVPVNPRPQENNPPALMGKMCPPNFNGDPVEEPAPAPPAVPLQK